MRDEKKPRVDTSAERIPLTDNPFAQLAGVKEALAKAPPQPAQKPLAEIIPADAPRKRAEFHVSKTRKGGYNLAIERRGGNSVVTIVRGVELGAEALLAQLKKRCGAGGALREDGVEIQGDHRPRVEKFLKESLG